MTSDITRVTVQRETATGTTTTTYEPDWVRVDGVAMAAWKKWIDGTFEGHVVFDATEITDFLHDND